MQLAFNTVYLLQCKTLNFLSPELWPRRPMSRAYFHWLQNLGIHTAAWVYDLRVKRLNKLSQQLAEVRQCSKRAFEWKGVILCSCVSPGSAEALDRCTWKTKCLILPKHYQNRFVNVKVIARQSNVTFSLTQCILRKSYCNYSVLSRQKFRRKWQ